MTNAQSPWGIDQIRLKQEDLGNLTEEQQKAIDEECALFNKCFSTASGQKVLDILVAKLDTVVWNPQLGPNYGYYNQGQNDVLNFIIRRVNYVRRDKK